MFSLIIEQEDSGTLAGAQLTVTFTALLFHLQTLFLYLLCLDWYMIVTNSHDDVVVAACVDDKPLLFILKYFFPYLPNWYQIDTK